MKFELSDLRNSAVWGMYRMRARIQLDPDYQRQSDIWTHDNRQLLIDTVLNDFDIPKLYLHKFKEPLNKGGKTFDYAIIDGKQRFETIRAFIDGEFALAEDFEFIKDSSVKAANMKYAELGQAYPDLKAQFDGYVLDVVCIETDDLEMIEEMFSRLNEAVPLTAPEKRNAYGGPLPTAIRKLASASFFKKSLPFPNNRYRHYDLAVKFLQAQSVDKVVDTKKVYLDKFVEGESDKSRNAMPTYLENAQDNVANMAKVFTHKDSLLRQVGMLILYYHLFRIAEKEGWVNDITRKKLAEFDVLRAKNRKAAEDDKKADYNLLEFDRYAQSPNDGYAIKFRLRIMLWEVFKKKASTDDL